MDFGGHATFADVDDAGLFVDTANEDFSLPPAQTNVNPESTQQFGGNPSTFTKAAIRSQEPTSRPNLPQRRPISPAHRRNMGAGFPKSQLARPTGQTPTSRAWSLKDSVNRAYSMQVLGSRLSSLETK